jgi:hypothetical protein
LISDPTALFGFLSAMPGKGAGRVKFSVSFQPACPGGSVKVGKSILRKSNEFLSKEEDMKKKVLPGVFLFGAVALMVSGAIFVSTGCKDAETAYEQHQITVLNPAITAKMVEREPLAPRAATLDGKTIYFVDLQWGGPQAGYSVFEEMQKWFAKNKPSIKTVLRRSKGGWMGDDPELRKEIADNKAAGVVIGIGG